MFCRSCGKQLNDEAQFCNGCGTQLKVVDAAAPAPRPPVDVQAPFVVPEPPAAVPLAPQATASKPNVGLIVALIVAGVLVVGAAVATGLYFTGAFGKVGIASTRTDEGTAKAKKGATSSEEDTAVIDGDGDGAENTATLSDDESYDAISEHYFRLGTLSADVGKAYTDEYGGTGFAYDVFNKKIGVSDASVREELANECQDMLGTISGAKQGLDELRVSSSYEPQKETLLGLYALLERRMQAMLGAAEAAVSNPEESAWRPILTPSSTETREQFDAEYPSAEPVRQ